MNSIRAEWIGAIKAELQRLDKIEFKKPVFCTVWHGYAYGYELIVELNVYNTDKPKLYFGKGFCAHDEMDFNKVSTKILYYTMINLPEAVDEMERYIKALDNSGMR